MEFPCIKNTTFGVNVLEFFAEWLQKCQEIWLAVSKPQSKENAAGSCKSGKIKQMMPLSRRGQINDATPRKKI